MISATTYGPVLLVDDNDDLRDGLAWLLEDAGYDVLSASSGQAALERLRERPDVRLMLLDLSMPSMDGGAFRRAQLAEARIATIPVVVLSARLDCERAGAELGPIACFRKNV